MRDTTLQEPFAVTEIFVDGFSDHVIQNGVMMCAGYRLQPDAHNGEPQRFVVIRLVWPAGATEEAIADAKQAQREPLFVRTGDRVGRH